MIKKRMKINRKFVSDLDILKAGIWVTDKDYVVSKAILRLFYGIKINQYFEFSRDYRKFGWNIKYN